MAGCRYFIAHSEKDRAFIKKFCKRLERAGIHDYYLAEAPAEFKNDKCLAKTITDELNSKCQCVIGIITARSFDWLWVNQEIAFGLGAGKKVVLIVEEGITPPPLVQAHQYGHFYGSEISRDISKRVIPYLLNVQ